jgi:TatD DNase family protein
MIVDSHCHLDFPDFAPERDAVVARAKAAGVGTLLTISTEVGRFDPIKTIAEAHADVWCTIGTHPMHANEEPNIPLETYIALSSHPKCVGIGEAGLDFHYDTVPRDIADRVFRTQIDAARQTGLPLVIHSRNADDAMRATLEDEMGKGAFKAVLHCFSSGRKLAETGIALGLYVSLSGILTYKNSDEIRQIAADVPLDRLLVETDAPYLSPQSRRGKRNEPAYVVETHAVLASVKGIPEPELARLTTDNFFRLFTKANRPAEPSAASELHAK